MFLQIMVICIWFKRLVVSVIFLGGKSVQCWNEWTSEDMERSFANVYFIMFRIDVTTMWHFLYFLLILGYWTTLKLHSVAMKLPRPLSMLQQQRRNFKQPAQFLSPSDITAHHCTRDRTAECYHLDDFFFTSLDAHFLNAKTNNKCPGSASGAVSPIADLSFNMDKHFLNITILLL